MANIRDLEGCVGGEVKIYTSAGLCYWAQLKKVEFDEKGARIEVDHIMVQSRGASIWTSLNDLPKKFQTLRDADFSSCDKLVNGTVHLNSVVLGDGGLLYIFCPLAKQTRKFV